MQSKDRHVVYKSLETDEEFIARVKASHPWFWAATKGVVLDDEIWWSFRMQRKIVERMT